MSRKNIIALIMTLMLTLQLLLSGGFSKVGSFKVTDTAETRPAPCEGHK